MRRRRSRKRRRSRRRRSFRKRRGTRKEPGTIEKKEEEAEAFRKKKHGQIQFRPGFLVVGKT